MSFFQVTTSKSKRIQSNQNLKRIQERRIQTQNFHIHMGVNGKQLSNVSKIPSYVSDSVLEKKAEEELSKGYNKRNKKCNKCYTLTSVTGECINCD